MSQAAPIKETPTHGSDDERAGSTALAHHTQQVADHLAGGAGAGTVPPARLARHLMRLKWTLWKRSFRKNIGKLIGTIVGVLYGLSGLGTLTVLLGGAALLLDGAGPGLFAQLVRGLGALLVLTWTLLPLIAFGLDDTLDPRRFAALPRSARELQPGLFAASGLSLPTLFTVLGVLIASVCEVLWVLTSPSVATGWGIAAIVVMIPVNLLGVALCVLLPRAVLAQSSTRQSSRRGRESGGLIVLIAGIAIMYAFSLFAQRLGDGIDMRLLGRILEIVAGILAWTPFGALFAVPVDLAEGHALVAAARLLIGCAGIILVWLWWRRSLDLALRSALVGEASSGSVGTSSLVPRFVRADATGASMGRALRYWRRDSRYLAGIAATPLMLVFFTAMGMMSPDMREFSIAMILMMVGMSSVVIMNEIGFDGPAGWVNITAGIPSRANLLGRIRAAAMVTVPLALFGAVGAPILLGLAPLVLMMLPGAIGVMLGGWGASMLIGVLMPYPTAPPGTNPMKDKSASSGNAMIAMLLGMVAVWVPQLPAVALAIAGLITGILPLQLAAGAVSLLMGGLTLILLLRRASRILDRRYADLFQKVRAFV